MPAKCERRPFPTERIRYYRRYLDAFDKPGQPIVIEIPKSIALYLLDGADKHERLEKSDSEHPLLTYAKRSEVWRAVSEAAAATSAG